MAVGTNRESNMQQVEPISPVEVKRVSPMLLIIGGILALTMLFLLFPSSRTAKVSRAKERLKKEFVGPKDLSDLYTGYFVTSKNMSLTIGPKSNAELSVFAAKPTSLFSSRYFEEVDGNNWNMYGNKTLHACLLAPDPTSTGWSLYAKVWIALTLQNDRTPMFNLGNLVSSGDATTMKKLRDIWAKQPFDIQATAEYLLDSNRKLVKGMPGAHRFYQDGSGTIYKLDPLAGPYEFFYTYNEAHPIPQSDR